MSEESKKWYRMTRPLFNSGYEDDEFWAYGQDGFREALSSFLGSDVLVYDKRMAVEPRKVRVVIQQRTGDSYTNSVIRQALCEIGVLRCGQYVKFEGGIWLVVSMPDNNRIYEKAVLWKCKHSIRFVSPLTGQIVEYPVFSENSTQYGTGEEEKTQMRVGDDQHLIYLPYNEETILLENQFRFLMDKNRAHPTAYRVTRVDPVSYGVGDERWEDGLIQWAVIEDQFNGATDNAALMVADYYTREAGKTEETPGDGVRVTITDLDGDFKLALGETKKLQILFTDEWGRPLEPPKYRLTYDLGDAATLEDDGEGTVTLTALDDPANVGKSVEVKAADDARGCEAAIKIQIVDW